MKLRDLKLWLSLATLATMAVYCLLVPEEVQFVSQLAWVYLIAWLAILYAIVDRKSPAWIAFKPSALLLLYVSTFFLLGAIAYRFGLVVDTAERFNLYTFRSLGFVTSYVLAGFIILLLVWRLPSVRIEGAPGRLPIDHTVDRKELETRRGTNSVLLSVVILTICLLLKLFGWAPAFLDPAAPFVFSALHLSSHVFIAIPRLRVYVYAGLALVLASVFYDDRRLLAFFLFTLFFMEYSRRERMILGPGTVWKGVAIVGGFVTLVVAMSILRGVGEFDADSLYSAVANVTGYFRMEDSMTMLLHNLEFAPTLFHTYDAIHYAVETGNYLYGETIVKILFLFVPREAFEIKPDSMVHLYTSTLYADYRYVGGSWVPNILAEAYWNFGYLGGLIFLAVLLRLFDRIYVSNLRRLSNPSSIDSVLFLSCYFYLIFLFRGSGLDLYAYYCILSLLTWAAYKIFGRLALLGRRARWQ